MNDCWYGLGGLNYKHGYTSCCAIQHNRLAWFKDSYLPSEIYNSKNFVKLRRDLASGKWPSGCNLCQDMVEKGVRKTAMINDKPAKYLQHYNKNGVMKFDGLRHIELRFSNACNMACLHCSTVYSSQWQKKLQGYEPQYDDYYLDQLNANVHVKDGEDPSKLGLNTAQVEEICNDLNKNFPQIEKVDISGGEVLIQKQFWKTLELLADHPNAKEMFMTFYSNFNADADYVKLSDKLSKFGSSDITISIDAGTNIYPYFRDGNWNKLVDNISKFREVNDFTNLKCVVTFSAYQLMDIENIYKSIYPLDFFAVKTALVQTPKYINPAILIHDFRDELLEDFNNAFEYIKSLPKSDKGCHPLSVRMSLEHYLVGLKKYLFESPLPHYRDYNNFLLYIGKTDKLWNQNFNDHFKKFKYIEGEIVRA